jgi:hypothetical protein
MAPDDRAVDLNVFEIRALGQPLEETLPYALLGPPPEASIGALPIAKLIGNAAPRRLSLLRIPSAAEIGYWIYV